MCTLLLATGLWPEAPLVVAANRDERLDRPAAPPSLWLDGPLPLLAPRDLEAGGTWLGLNGAGVFAGLTNRFGKPPDRVRRSRGEIVVRALEAPDALTAFAAMGALDPEAYNPFHLVVADRRGAGLVWSDGAALFADTLAPGVHFVTERSFGAAASGRHDLLSDGARALAAGPCPSQETLAGLLTTHADFGLDGVCVHLGGRPYGTRSSTLLWQGAAPDADRLLYADGPPCRTPYEDLAPLVRALAAAGHPEPASALRSHQEKP